MRTRGKKDRNHEENRETWRNKSGISSWEPGRGKTNGENQQDSEKRGQQAEDWRTCRTNHNGKGMKSKEIIGNDKINIDLNKQ